MASEFKKSVQYMEDVERQFCESGEFATFIKGVQNADELEAKINKAATVFKCTFTILMAMEGGVTIPEEKKEKMLKNLQEMEGEVKAICEYLPTFFAAAIEYLKD